MSTVPPGGSQQPPYAGIPARLPLPGNAELAVLVVVEVVIAIVAAVADTVGAHDWVVATTWITAAYLISRGVAKASRVLEQ